MFKNKILLITGGTGSFGNSALRRFLNLNIKEIRIFSRDEKKKDDMPYRRTSASFHFFGDGESDVKKKKKKKLILFIYLCT